MYINQVDVSTYPWTCWEKSTFEQNVYLKALNFFVWKLSFRQNGVVRHLENVQGGDGAETFSVSGQSETQAYCDMAIIDISEFPRNRYDCSLNVNPLFNVAPLVGN